MDFALEQVKRAWYVVSGQLLEIGHKRLMSKPFIWR